MYGKSDTLGGKLVNWLLFEVPFEKKANGQLIIDDMKEDSTHLKQILETGFTRTNKY